MHALQDRRYSQQTSLICVKTNEGRDCCKSTKIWLYANRQKYDCGAKDNHIYGVGVVSIIDNLPGEGNGGQVADSRLFRTGVLNDLSAQVAALDGAQVLLVGLAVAAVLVQHVWVASLNLHLP